MANLMQAVIPPQNRVELNLQFQLREDGKFELPKAEGDLKQYVFCIKPNTLGVHNLTFGPFSAMTHCYPPEASLVKNHGRPKDPQIPTLLLAENQVEYIRSYLETRTKVVRRRYVNGQWREEEHRQFSELIILCTPQEYYDAGYSVDLSMHEDQKKYEAERAKGLVRKEEQEKIRNELVEMQLKESAGQHKKRK